MPHPPPRPPAGTPPTGPLPPTGPYPPAGPYPRSGPYPPYLPTGTYPVAGPPSPPPDNRLHWVPLTLIVLALLLLAAAAVLGRAWLTDTPDQPATSQPTGSATTSGKSEAADVAAACQVVRRLPALTDDPEQLGLPFVYRLRAAGDLTAAAAHTSRQYQPLADTLQAALRSAQTADTRAADQQIRAARDTCAQL